MYSAQVPKLFSELKSKQLSALLRGIGVRATGVKTDLNSRLTAGLRQQRFENRDGPTRIISIDMGIKNLAFCVCDVHIPGSASMKENALHTKRIPSGDRIRQMVETLRPSLTVQDWKSLSLIDSLEDRLRKGNGFDDCEGDVDIYHPRNMSRTALDLVSNTLLPYRPTLILIERQRFRSAGRSQVQEWTIRVNMLESMLHSTLVTLEQEGQLLKDVSVPTVCSVSPARVATYWSSHYATREAGSEAKSSGRSGDGVAGRKRSSTRSVKKEKTDLVRNWAKAPGMAPVVLDFAGDGERMRQILGSGSRVKRSGQVTDTHEDTKHPSKLDDLADCLLQATAWVQWEANRRILLDRGVKSVEELNTFLELMGLDERQMKH